MTPPVPPQRRPIELTVTAQAQLAEITDRRTQQTVAQTIGRLDQEPEHQGNLLVGGLAGYRSLRAAGQRYRIVYKVELERVVSYDVAPGLHKAGDKRDIFELAKKLLRQGLLEPPHP